MAAFPYSAGTGLDTASLGFSSRVTEGRVTPVVCGACGCRLEERSDDAGSTAWYHFEGSAGRDARGCNVVCTAFAHDAAGDALSPF